MPGSFGFNFGDSSSKSTQRSGTKAEFPKQFLQDYNNFLGGPFTIGDLFRLAPRSQSLFGGEPSGPYRPGGGFNLGFGLPPVGGPGESAAPPSGATGGSGNGGGGATGSDTGAKKPQVYGINDILPAWDDDPEKRMDIERFFRQSRLNPDGFTRDEFAAAVGKGKQFGFSGRSMGNFGKALASLRSDDQLNDSLGGGTKGRGSGIF